MVMKKSTKISDEYVASILKTASYLLDAGFLLGLLFSPEDGGYNFLRNSSVNDLERSGFGLTDLLSRNLAGSTDTTKPSVRVPGFLARFEPNNSGIKI
jgi:hypothetical protein